MKRERKIKIENKLEKNHNIDITVIVSVNSSHHNIFFSYCHIFYKALALIVRLTCLLVFRNRHMPSAKILNLK